MSPEEPKYWLDDPKNVDLVVYVLYGVCAGLVLLDLTGYKHTHYGFEGWFGFYGFYGLIGCVGLVLAAKGLRVFVKRDEDYYD